MSAYQVVRRFGGYAPGDVLAEGELLSSHRAAQLVASRYLAPLPADIGQPTVSMLLKAPVKKLEALLRQVEDPCVVDAALTQETRETARKLMEARAKEMTNEPSH